MLKTSPKDEQGVQSRFETKHAESLALAKKRAFALGLLPEGEVDAGEAQRQLHQAALQALSNMAEANEHKKKRARHSHPGGGEFGNNERMQAGTHEDACLSETATYQGKSNLFWHVGGGQSVSYYDDTFNCYRLSHSRHLSVEMLLQKTACSNLRLPHSYFALYFFFTPHVLGPIARLLTTDITVDHPVASLPATAATFLADERERTVRGLTLSSPLSDLIRQRAQINTVFPAATGDSVSNSSLWASHPAMTVGGAHQATFHAGAAAGLTGLSDSQLTELMGLRALLASTSGGGAVFPDSAPALQRLAPFASSPYGHLGLSHQQAQIETLLALRAQASAQTSNNYLAQQTPLAFAPPAPIAGNDFTVALRSAADLLSNHTRSLFPQSRLQTEESLVHSRSQPFFSLPNASSSSSNGFPSSLPVILARPEDGFKLSSHQVFLRHQIEVFQATEDDVSTHTRGRNKPISFGQVGIRCRHCAHLPVSRRQKGSTYFPASLLGLYQAAQNMCTTHMQCGLCTEMPVAIKQQFSQLLNNKSSSSGAGRPYWAKTAAKLGLVDTEEGIRFNRDSAGVVKIVASGEKSFGS